MAVSVTEYVPGVSYTMTGSKDVEVGGDPPGNDQKNEFALAEE